MQHRRHYIASRDLLVRNFKNPAAWLSLVVLSVFVLPGFCFAGPTQANQPKPTASAAPVKPLKPTKPVKSEPPKPAASAPVDPAALIADRPPGQVQLLDMVLASIEDEPITIVDLRDYAEQQGKALPENVLGGDPVVRQLLRDLVLTKLIEREAAATGVSVSDEEVNAYINEIKRQNNVDDQGLARLLASKGLSFEIYKRQVRDDIFKTRVVGMQVRNKITVTDEEVQRLLAGKSTTVFEDGEEDVEVPGVRLFQIRFPKVEGNEEAALKEAEDARKRIDSGETWAAVGNEKFTDLGTVVVSELRPEFSDVVDDLSEDDLSEIIDTPDAVYLLMIPSADKIKASTTNTDTDKIRQQIYQEKFAAALNKFLNDDLPKKYHVELKL